MIINAILIYCRSILHPRYKIQSIPGKIQSIPWQMSPYFYIYSENDRYRIFIDYNKVFTDEPFLIIDLNDPTMLETIRAWLEKNNLLKE